VNTSPLNPHDHAVVIGIRRYWDATPDGWITNLNAPDNDAEAIAQWLRQPDGGGLPEGNVCIVRSADLPDPFPDEESVGPHQRAVENALNNLADLDTTAFEGQYAGRRLYVYVSGHGFARGPDEAALLTAEAKRTRPLNVLVSSWVDWLWHAARFKEYVLWVDTCAARAPVTTYFKPCDRDPEYNQDVANGRRFTAFAAGLNKTTVENEMSDGKWHSVFTHALLQGLNGGARTPITTNSLRDYLSNAMSSFMRDDQQSNSMVAKEPEFARTDELVFGQRTQPATFPVTFQFPRTWVGRRVTISVNSKTPLIAETIVQQDRWTPQLGSGLYVLFAPESGDFQPFAVSGGPQNVNVP
jgi:Caspase domain